MLRFAFLSLVAYRMFSQNQHTLPESTLDELATQYHREYKVALPRNLLHRLADARVISVSGETYQFRYSYYYYYFVARYLWEALSEPAQKATIRRHLDTMIKAIHYEPYANILTFYVFFSRDIETIRSLVDYAKTVYSDHQPCNFESDVAFVNSLYVSRPVPLLLPSEDTERNVEQYRRRLDEANANDTESDNEDGPDAQDDTATGSQIADLVKVNIATKLMHILGQIVRNSPGSLKAEVKQELVQETYNLGLRTLKALLQIPADNIERVRTYFAKLFQEEWEHRAELLKTQSSFAGVLDPLKPEEIAQKADQGVIWLSEGFGYGIVRRIALAIGLEQLADIYKDVLKASGKTLPFEIIDLAVELEYFKTAPEGHIRSLYHLLRKNFYAQNTVRQLVMTYLYLIPVNYKTRQNLAALLSLDAGNPKLLENPAKKGRRSGG